MKNTPNLRGSGCYAQNTRFCAADDRKISLSKLLTVLRTEFICAFGTLHVCKCFYYDFVRSWRGILTGRLRAGGMCMVQSCAKVYDYCH